MIKRWLLLAAMALSLASIGPAAAYYRCWWDGYRWACPRHYPDGWQHRDWQLERRYWRHGQPPEWYWDRGRYYPYGR